MKRHNLVQDIITKLQTITIANGYNSDFTNKVVSWKSDQIPESTSMWVEVQDASAEVPGEFTFPNVEFRLAINIVIFCASGATTAENIRKAMDDIYRKLINSRESFTTTYGRFSMKFTGDDMEVFEEDIVAGVGIVGCVFTFIELFTPAVPLPPEEPEE